MSERTMKTLRDRINARLQTSAISRDRAITAGREAVAQCRQSDVETLEWVLSEIDAALATPERGGEGEAGYWWCPECREEVDSSRVSYSEHHEDCGRGVIWKEPLRTPAASEDVRARLDQINYRWHSGAKLSDKEVGDLLGIAYTLATGTTPADVRARVRQAVEWGIEDAWPRYNRIYDPHDPDDESRQEWVGCITEQVVTALLRTSAASEDVRESVEVARDWVLHGEMSRPQRRAVADLLDQLALLRTPRGEGEAALVEAVLRRWNRLAADVEGSEGPLTETELVGIARDVAAALRSEAQGEEWRPIETAPKDGTRILIGWGDEIRAAYWDPEYESLWDEDAGESRCRGAWTDGAVRSFGYEETMEYKPTHWTPLPDPPAARRGEGGGE